MALTARLIFNEKKQIFFIVRDLNYEIVKLQSTNNRPITAPKGIVGQMCYLQSFFGPHS